MNFITNSQSQGSLNNSEFIPKLSESIVSIYGFNSFRFSENFCSGAFQVIGKEGKYSYIKNVSFKTALTGKILSLEVVCPGERKKEGSESGF